MKRDIQINISILEEIYRKVKTYIDALTQLEHASKDFEEAIKEQKSEAYEALSELWENNISQKESKIKWQLVIVADLLKDYINAMQEYIQPLNEAQNMRVDRDDILWNLQQINSYIYNFNWIINDDGQSWNDYSRPFVYDKSEDKETNAVRRRIQEELENQERIRRQNNYSLLAAFREELKKETSVSSYTSTIYAEMCEIEKIYDNNIVPFENTDDLFAGKMKGYYDEWKSITNTVEDFTEVVYSFGRGLRQVGLDTLEDAIHMGNLLYVQELQAMGQEVPEELQDDVNTYIKNLRDGISNTITDPGNTIEAIGQNIFDTVDEEGLAYATGYIAPEVAIALATKKMTGKGPKVKGGTGVADDVVEEVLEGGTSAIKSSDLVFGSSTKSTQKLMNQMNSRGWTEDLIRNTVDNPYTIRTSVNKATGNSATVFYTQQGSYVIVDDVTKAIVQISDNINPSTWAPDLSIVDPYIPD